MRLAATAATLSSCFTLLSLLLEGAPMTMIVSLVDHDHCIGSIAEIPHEDPGLLFRSGDKNNDGQMVMFHSRCHEDLTPRLPS